MVIQLDQPGKAKKLTKVNINLPFISERDICSYGFAINRIKENRTLMVCCSSIDNDLDFFKHKYVAPNDEFVRADLRMFNFQIQLISKNKMFIKSLINIDPKIEFLPQTLLDLACKQVQTILIVVFYKFIR